MQDTDTLIYRTDIVNFVVDTKNDIKRTYFIPHSIDVDVKIRAAKDDVKQSDVVVKALELYLYSQDKKGKK